MGPGGDCKRELILSLLAQKLTQKEIAKRLGFRRGSISKFLTERRKTAQKEIEDAQARAESEREQLLNEKAV